jgi:hypothetical protein
MFFNRGTYTVMRTAVREHGDGLTVRVYTVDFEGFLVQYRGEASFYPHPPPPSPPLSTILWSTDYLAPLLLSLGGLPRSQGRCMDHRRLPAYLIKTEKAIEGRKSHLVLSEFRDRGRGT